MGLTPSSSGIPATHGGRLFPGAEVAKRAIHVYVTHTSSDAPSSSDEQTRTLRASGVICKQTPPRPKPHVQDYTATRSHPEIHCSISHSVNFVQLSAA
ncbi:unnamed protein product [Lasius platythorax]|uniref:Uncharacterized protein n=1 Tax=Lasius platythorax TaxID=488582 RepID=A0AAV2N2R1_9HYME